MHNAYVSSTLYALRSKGYLSFPFNDYYLLNDRRNQAQCCSCCGFSSHSSCKLPIHKSCYYVYGPRQSSLLQWSAYRKLLYRDRDRYCGYYYYDYCCNGSPIDVSCCVNERVVCARRSTVKCRCRVVGDEGDYGRVCDDDDDDDDDTEVLLSLLGDGGVGKRWNRGLYRRVELKGRERDSGAYRRASSGDGVCECGKRRNGGFESTRVESREEGKRSDGKRREGVSRGENRRLRNESSSSYYSVSSSGDFDDYDDDDSDVHDKHTLSTEETLSGYEDITGKVGKREEASELRNNEFVGSVEWDRRKKSEKQRSDRVVEEARRSEISASHERFNGAEAETSRKHYAQIENQVGEVSSSRRKFVENTEIQKINRDESKITSQSRVRVDHNKENVEQATDERRRIARYRTEEDIKRNTQRNSEVRDYDTQRTSISQNRAEIGEYRKNDVSSSQMSQETSARRNSQQAVRISEIHDTTTNIANTSVTDSRVNVSNRVNNTDSISVSLGPQTSQRPPRRVQSGGQESDAGRNSQQAIRISEIHGTTNIENTSILESRVNVSNQVNDTNLVSVSLGPQISQRPPQRVQSGGQETIRISEIHDTSVDNTSMVQSQVNISNQVNNTNLISVSHQGSGLPPPRPQMSQRPPRRVQSYNVDETASIVDSRVASETRLRQESDAVTVGMTISGNNRVSGNLRPIRPGNELEEASSSRERSRTDYRARIEKEDVEEGIHRQSLQTMVMPPRSQSLTRSSVRDELESGFESERQRASNTTLESSSGYARTPAIDLNQDSYERTERLETPGEPPLYLDAPEDALGSNDRLQQSSARIVGEFVEAFSSSEVVASRDDYNRQEESTEPKKEDERTSLPGGSGTAGPSAEMWDLTVTAPSVIRTPKAEEESETVTTMPTTENALIVKRSGRSLWNIIADIVTLKWGPRTEPSPTPRSSRRITSNESAGSETWLSTQESAELSRGDNSKGSRSESKSDHLQVTELSTTGRATESDRFTDQTRYTEPEESPSPSTTRVASGSINLGWNEDGKSSKASPASSGMEMVESPLRPTIRGESSTVITSQVSVGAKMEINPAAIETSLLPEGSSGSELKRRKLQRIKQVPKDRFDEWEEAFTIETDQRRLDEMFMREALVEAKKAADTWEVPVGAVLVHNGTVIARGYNLVEELRDSTAHAEMICIREASNQLRSWRLSDTTLYVTLEPCPMCAGAILQARVPNLVWGAPNKLLGADGSWIRLFPDGGEGGNSSEVSDKPAPPPHPFHPKMNIRRGVLATECSEVMQQFFQLRRKKKEIAAVESPTSRPSSSHHPSKLLKKMHDVFHITFCL